MVVLTMVKDVESGVVLRTLFVEAAGWWQVAIDPYWRIAGLLAPVAGTGCW